MKVGEEDGVLRVDLVCVHRHDGDVVMLALYRPRHVDTPSRLGSRESPGFSTGST
jgi:hypothetical protein